MTINRCKAFQVFLASALTAFVALGCSSDSNDDGDSGAGNDVPKCPDSGANDTGGIDEAVSCGADDFRPGATVSLSVAGSVRSQTQLQAIADLSISTGAMIDELTEICRNIATDLDAPVDKRASIDRIQDKNKKAEAWCELASSRIMEHKAGASLKVEFRPPECTGSFSALSDCCAKCSSDGSCDGSKHSPTCEGGRLIISCSGNCVADTAMECEGKCVGTCSGSCATDVGGQCEGKCDGTCEKGGGGSGVDPDGTCRGVCKGICHQRSPSACEGVCIGTCSGTCDLLASYASVKCDGKCSGLYEPLLCKGGKIDCGCNVDATCQGLCEASINAKAACEQQAEVTITVSGGMQPKHIKLKATLDRYYSRVFEIGFKAKALGSAAGDLKASIAGMTDVKVACMPNIMAIAKDIGSSFTSTVKIVSSLEATLS